MPSVTVAMAVIEQGDVYHFQLRNGASMTGALGLIGCFGGQIEQGETPAEALCRELSEESNLSLVQQDLQYLGEVKAIAERKGRLWDIYAKVFHVLLDQDILLIAKEGELATIPKNEVSQVTDRLTPATLATFEQLVEI